MNLPFPVKMLSRQEVKCWPTVTLKAELDYIKAWLWQHLSYDKDIGLWSEKMHNMEVIERELRRGAREERERQH